MNIEIEQGRIHWLDTARGIAILLVILGHCIGTLEDPGNKLVLSFHMPLFFFISGFCAGRLKAFPAYLIKKAKVFLIPTITLGVLDTLTDIISNQFVKDNLVNNFLGWFLLVLFYVSILFYIVQKLGFEKKNWVRLLTFIIDIIIIFSVNKLHITTLLHIEIIPMALLFFLIGYQCKISCITLAERKSIRSDIWILLIPFVIVCSTYNTSVTMYLNDYGNILLFFICAFSGIIVICKIAKGLEDNKLIIWIGQNTIYFYVLHFAFIKGLHFIGKSIFPELTSSNYSYPIYWIYFWICIVLLIPVVMLCKRWFSILFGK